MSPADYVISVFSGVRATARALDCDHSTISRWRKARSEGGTGGEIPTRRIRQIIGAAAKLGLHVDITKLLPVHNG